MWEWGRASSVATSRKRWWSRKKQQNDRKFNNLRQIHFSVIQGITAFLDLKRGGYLEIWGSHWGTAELSGILGCKPVSAGGYLLIFLRTFEEVFASVYGVIFQRTWVFQLNILFDRGYLIWQNNDGDALKFSTQSWVFLCSSKTPTINILLAQFFCTFADFLVVFMNFIPRLYI